jgi:hypothetical protein
MSILNPMRPSFDGGRCKFRALSGTGFMSRASPASLARPARPARPACLACLARPAFYQKF